MWFNKCNKDKVHLFQRTAYWANVPVAALLFLLWFYALSPPAGPLASTISQDGHCANDGHPTVSSWVPAISLYLFYELSLWRGEFCFKSALNPFIQFELVLPRLTTHTFFSFSWFVHLWVGSQDTQETHDSCLLPANSFGDDEEPSTSSESDEDVTKQFEISVSRSQSFRTGAPEKGKTTELEPKTKCNHLLSVHREDSAEVSACEGIQFSLFFLHLGKGWPVVRMLVDNLNTCACRVQRGKRKGTMEWERVHKE